MLSDIRAFFSLRGVLEVETPLLAQAGNSDVHIESLTVEADFGGGDFDAGGHRRYLQTSPEFAMKRLLADGSGDIYQICKAFRAEEHGRLHNSEFTLLEWYRSGMDHHALMDELECLLGDLFAAFARPLPVLRRIDYAQAWQTLAGIDFVEASDSQWQRAFVAAGVDMPGFADAEERLDFGFATLVQPRLQGAWLVFDYPASQASLARLSVDNPDVAERFELFIDGVELANGFHELSDADQQRQRFEADLRRRRQAGRSLPPMDERLLAALEAGLPDCSGVAVGLDRLLMVLLGKTSIAEVMSFASNP